jgi:ATP adenylyltransferase
MDKHIGPEHLHAPWRMEYIEKAGKPAAGCIFCEKPRQQCDRENYLVYRGQYCFIILNVFPYNNGHLMVIPYQHTARLEELALETMTEMMAMARLAIRALKHAMSPDGFNLGMNIGRTAGAGIAEHVHLHVVPRWNGDTNFMPVIGNTRVLPESLERTWEKIVAAFEYILTEE